MLSLQSRDDGWDQNLPIQGGRQGETGGCNSSHTECLCGDYRGSGVVVRHGQVLWLDRVRSGG